MNVLRFRKDRRQRGPFTAAPVTRPAPAWSPEVTRQIADLTAQAEAEREAWFGLTELDNPPVHDRPYVPALADAPPPPPMPFSGVSKIMVSQVGYPDPADLSCDKDRHYREMLRRMGAATGTSASLEDTSAWPRLALEPGDGTGVLL